MSEYQFGQHLSFEEVLKEKEHYAKIFSEENPMLEKLLMRCFNNKVETYMCCTGHEEGDAAFLMLYIPYSNKELIYSIVNSVYDLNEVIIRLGKEHNREGILVDVKSYSTDYFFDLMYDGISMTPSTRRANGEIVNAVELLNKFNHDSYDLYVETSKSGDKRRYTIYADYTSMTPTGPRKQYYALREDCNYNRVISATECFSESKMEQKIREVAECDAKDSQKVKTILH